MSRDPDVCKLLHVGIRNALAAGSEELRRDLQRQLAGSVGELKDAAREVKGMVKRLTPLWAGIIAAGSLLLGVALMFFFVVAGQRRTEVKVDRMQQAAPSRRSLQPLCRRR